MTERRVLFVNWQGLDGAAQGKRKLHLRSNKNGSFTCPLKLCLHADFKSIRGLRKHIDNKHSWYYYFEEQPDIKREGLQPPFKRASTLRVPFYSLEEGRGKEILAWLGTICGGGKPEQESKQIGKWTMKYLNRMHR